jgi:glycosyltransferase involved in cell wall biosynthesis
MKIRPIKILHVVYAMNTGGVESWLMNIYRKLDKNKVQFDFLVNTQEKAFFDDEIRELGGQIYHAGALSSPLKIYSSAKKLMSENSYSAVHCHNVENAAPVLKAAIDCRVPNRIYQSHNDLNSKLQHLSLFKKAYLYISRKVALKYSTKFLAVSKSAGDSLFDGCDYQMLSLGIDVEKFNTNQNNCISKAEFGLSDEHFIVGHVGRFDTQKNHQFLVKIAKDLISLNPNTRILLIGKGVLEQKIRDQITKEKLDDYFVFTGLRNDVPEIMQCVMDAFLFPSLFEGLGLVLVEAQAAGLPIVCSDVIPDEAIVNAELVKKVSLSKTSKVWADELIERYKQNPGYDKTKAYKIIRNSAFNLNNTIKILEEIWQEKK